MPRVARQRNHKGGRRRVDWTGFEPMTPRVQGGYTTSLYYQPTQDMVRVWILIVVLQVSCQITTPKTVF